MRNILLGAALALVMITPTTAADLWRPVSAENLLVIDSSKGQIIVELRPDMAPNHVERVKRLAHEGFYDGLQFHRVIDGFMAQTGDPTNADDGRSSYPDLKPEFTFRRGADQPLTVVARPTGAVLGFLGSVPVQSNPDRVMAWTPDHKTSAWGLYCPGVVGAGRGDQDDSANSEFFLMREAAPWLDKRYTVWGRVVEGLAVVRGLKTGEPVKDPDVMIRVRLMTDLPAAEQRKVSLLDPASPRFAALVARTRKAGGADFSVCDLSVPVQVSR
jgi:peptidylprolyl isomerase